LAATGFASLFALAELSLLPSEEGELLEDPSPEDFSVDVFDEEESSDEPPSPPDDLDLSAAAAVSRWRLRVP
jgi:hypothetical protein